jgi:hypothetical protein
MLVALPARCGNRKFPHLYFVYFGATMHTAGVLLGTLLSLGSKSVNFKKGHFHFGRLMWSEALSSPGSSARRNRSP